MLPVRRSGVNDFLIDKAGDLSSAFDVLGFDFIESARKNPSCEEKVMLGKFLGK